MNLCPGIEGCTSKLADDFTPVYRYPTNGTGPSRYRTLPEIRARAKELGIENWDRLTRLQIVREIQNHTHHRACFATKPTACPEPECEWRENCLSALNIERFRSARARGMPAHAAAPPGLMSGSFATSARDLEFQAPAFSPPPATPPPSPMPSPMPAPATYSPLKPRAITSLSPMFDRKEPALPDVANQTFLQSKSETATPIRNPVLRWPPKKGSWTERDPD
jgi:hypothetical protein